MPQLPVLRNVSLEFIGKSTVVRAQIAEYDKKGGTKTRFAVCNVENRTTPDQSPHRVMRESITTGMRKRIMLNMTCVVYSPSPVLAN